MRVEKCRGTLLICSILYNVHIPISTSGGGEIRNRDSTNLRYPLCVFCGLEQLAAKLIVVIGILDKMAKAGFGQLEACAEYLLLRRTAF